MEYLLDTNVLLRFADRKHALNATVRTAIRKLSQTGNQMYVISQNLIEFWNVATRPVAQNGFGFSPAESEQKLRLLERIYPLETDSASLYSSWRRLVLTYGVSGVRVHDARLAAAKLALRRTHILTFNTVDFTRYAPEGIIAVDPANV